MQTGGGECDFQPRWDGAYGNWDAARRGTFKWRDRVQVEVRCEMWPPPSPSPVQPGWPTAPKGYPPWSVPAWPPLPPPPCDKHGLPLPSRRELKRWRRDLAMPPLEELAWLSSDDEDSDIEEFWAEEERLIAEAMKKRRIPDDEPDELTKYMAELIAGGRPDHGDDGSELSDSDSERSEVSRIEVSLPRCDDDDDDDDMPSWYMAQLELEQTFSGWPQIS